MWTLKITMAAFKAAACYHEPSKYWGPCILYRGYYILSEIDYTYIQKAVTIYNYMIRPDMQMWLGLAGDEGANSMITVPRSDGQHSCSFSLSRQHAWLITIFICGHAPSDYFLASVSSRPLAHPICQCYGGWQHPGFVMLY